MERARVRLQLAQGSDQPVTVPQSILDRLVRARVDPPQVTQQPQGATVPPGATAVLEVSARGKSPLFYQWFKDKQRVTGATGAVLTLDRVGVVDVGSYHCRINNADGATVSKTVVIQMGRAEEERRSLLQRSDSRGSMASAESGDEDHAPTSRGGGGVMGVGELTDAVGSVQL